jgi:DNA-binding response OmpR family regulator
MNRVLVVDDEPEMGSLVELCLDTLGLEVVQAGSLSSARTVVKNTDVDIVLLDLALGGEDGLEILPELRRSPGMTDVPVVAFTAHDSRRAEAFERGVDAFLARPFAYQDLQATVARHIKRR